MNDINPNSSVAFAAQNQHLFNDVALAQSGDINAFSRLVDHTRNMVTSIALAIVKDLDNSEDVAQQVYIGSWQQISSLKNTASFLPWLRQMTRYKALNFLRDNKVTKKVSGDEADLIFEQFCDPKTDAEEHLHREKSNLIVREFINQLPDESREIVLLYYREEQSSQQVARLLDQTESNVRKKLSRIRQLLREQVLEKHGKLLLSTAPTMAFSSFILAAITSSSPVAAAALGSTATTSQSGLTAKIGALLGGSMLGAFVGAIAIRFSTKLRVKNMALHISQIVVIFL